MTEKIYEVFLEMDYKVLALDLDGTLTNSRKEITGRTKEAIARFQEAGGIVVLASGRPVYGITGIARELNLQEHGGYILAFNGGQVVDCKTGETIFQKTIPEELIGDLDRQAHKNHVAIMTYQDENLITETPDDPYVRKEMSINHMGVKKVDSFTDYVHFPVTKCLLTEDGEYLAKVEKRVKESLGDQLSIYRSEPFFLEVMPEGIDKAKSLEQLLEHIHLSREDLAACGDGFNDQSMIEYAGLGVAMENGQQQVKEAADVIAPSNDEDGIAWVVSSQILHESGAWDRV